MNSLLTTKTAKNVKIFPINTEVLCAPLKMYDPTVLCFPNMVQYGPMGRKEIAVSFPHPMRSIMDLHEPLLLYIFQYFILGLPKTTSNKTQYGPA